MFLVDKNHFTSHFNLLTKKPLPLSKTNQLAATSFDDKIISHLKKLNPPSDISTISLNWLSKTVSFLSIVHNEAMELVSSFTSETEYYQALYMDYSQKVLDLSNLLSSAVQPLVERRMLLNLSLRLLNSGQLSSPEKIKKVKETLIRSINQSINQDQENISTMKGQRAKDLLQELTVVINRLSQPVGKNKNKNKNMNKIINVGDLLCRTLYGLGVLTLSVSTLLVSVLYGETELVQTSVPDVFVWADLVNGFQKHVSDMLKLKQGCNGGERKILLLEVEDVASRVGPVCDVLEEVVGDGDIYGGERRRVRLEDGVKEVEKVVAKFSTGVDELTNGVNGLFRSVMKTRNGVLDGVRKCDW